MDMMPNLILAGATRAGTTSLHHYLGQHPQIYLPRKKELHYFNVDENFQNPHFLERHLDRYNGEGFFGDFTPLYMCKGLLYTSISGKTYFSRNDSAVTRIAGSVPDAKILVTLRHPYLRYISQFQKNSSQGKFIENIEEKIKLDIQEFNDSDFNLNNYFYFNQYDIHLSEILNNFPRNNIHISIFEEWTKEPDSYCRDIFKFLGVSESEPIDASATQNSAKVYQNSFGSRLRRLKKQLWRQETLNRPTQATSRRLAQELEAQINYVEEVLKRPIPIWRSISEKLLRE